MRLTPRPMTVEATGLAPTTWNPRPIAVNLKMMTRRMARTTPTQKSRVTPRKVPLAHSESPAAPASGLRPCCSSGWRYR